MCFMTAAIQNHHRCPRTIAVHVHEQLLVLYRRSFCPVAFKEVTFDDGAFSFCHTTFTQLQTRRGQYPLLPPPHAHT